MIQLEVYYLRYIGMAYRLNQTSAVLSHLQTCHLVDKLIEIFVYSIEYSVKVGRIEGVLSLSLMKVSQISDLLFRFALNSSESFRVISSSPLFDSLRLMFDNHQIFADLACRGFPFELLNLFIILTTLQFDWI